MENKINNHLALIIGVGADLPTTVVDAKGIFDFLVDRDRCGFEKSNVKLLVEAEADKIGIEAGLTWLASESSSKSTVLVYFSGHGAGKPHFALIPNDFDSYRFQETTIGEQYLSKILSEIAAKKLIVLLDCCHAGGQAILKDKFLPQSPYPKEIERIFSESSGRVLLASSRQDELSYIGDPYSEFTRAIIEGLCGYGASEADGYSRILDIAIWAARKVPERTNDKQNPIIKVQNLEDNFVVSFYSGGSPKFSKIHWRKFQQTDIDEGTVFFKDEYISMLRNYQENLLLVQQRMSEFIDFTSIPLQLLKTKKQIERKIQELELMK